MKQIWSNNNISLCLFEDTHSEELFSLFLRNKIELSIWMNWANSIDSIEDVTQIIEEFRINFKSDGKFEGGIFVEGVLVGGIGMDKYDKENKTSSIGYWLDKGNQGKGIITQACQGLIRYCKEILGVNRIEIRCSAKNDKSNAVAKRLGFTFEGVLRESELVNRQFCDQNLYSLIAKDFN